MASLFKNQVVDFYEMGFLLMPTHLIISHVSVFADLVSAAMHQFKQGPDRFRGNRLFLRPTTCGVRNEK